MTVLVVDNYDSFVHSLVRTLREVGATCRVVRNDQITLDQVRDLAPSHLVISPGPCGPDRAGISLDLIRRFAPTVPLLGVCLGHQCLAQAFGGRVVRTAPVHGRTSTIEPTHPGRGIFHGLPSHFQVTRYHSLAVDETIFPADLEITARSDDGVVMALRHREYPAVGIQFHPEAVLTEGGHQMLQNFLDGRP